MSEKRLSIFLESPNQEFPDGDKLIELLHDGNFLLNDPKRAGYYILSTKFMSLLDQTEASLDASKQVCVWLEYLNSLDIQTGSDSQNIEVVKSPDGSIVLGDLDFAYSLIGELSIDIDADYTDPTSGKIYKIRDLDFSNYVGYGRSYIHVDCYFKPTSEFMRELEQIIDKKLKWCLFWL